VQADPRPTDTPVSLWYAALVLLPFGLGYFLSYLFRAVNAVVAPDLMRELGLSASSLGLLTAAYLLSFSLFQLPLGVLLDRYGPRRVQTGLVALAAVGAFLFAKADSLAGLSAARALIGIGFAGALMGGFKAVVIWVRPERRALFNSLVMSLGGLGLLVSTAPTEWAVSLYGWRSVFLALAAVTIAVSALIFVAVPERSSTSTVEPLSSQIGALGRIYRDRAFLVLAPFLATTAGTHVAIQTLWAGLWFRDVAGFDRPAVANGLFAMAAAFFVGILASGTIADWFRKRGVDELTVMLGFLALFMASQVLIVADLEPLRMVAWIIFGMSGQVAVLAYPWLSLHFGAALSGRANTAMNLVLFVTAFAVQYLIGKIIDLYPRTAAGGYPPVAYQVAFGVFLAAQFVALALFLANRRLFSTRP
jgi:predicted MFS family arabinose efflux permease